MSAIYDPAYPIRWLLSVNSAQVTGSHSGFPVCVRLDDLGSQFFADLGAVGGKLRVTDVTGTVEYAYDLAHYDQAAEKGKLFVKMDIDDVTDKQFYVFVGNNGATPYAPGDTYGRNNLWPNHVFLAHDGINDVSPVNASPSSVTDISYVDGKIGQAAQFNGSSSRAEYPGKSNYNISGDRTFSCWIKVNDGASTGRLISYQTGAGGLDGVYFTKHNSTFARIDLFDTASYQHSYFVYHSFNVWTKLDFVYTDAAKFVGLAINGGNLGGISDGSFNGFAPGKLRSLIIGALNPTTELFSGLAQEISIKTGNVSNDWRITEYDNQNDPSAFITVVGRELNGNPFTPKIIIL